jgi:hypothetical protein
MGATIKTFWQDTVMKRISKSTLKLWRKQDREKLLGRESRALPLNRIHTWVGGGFLKRCFFLLKLFAFA